LGLVFLKTAFGFMTASLVDCSLRTHLNACFCETVLMKPLCFGL